MKPVQLKATGVFYQRLKPKACGFSLLEFVAVLALLGGLLISFTQWRLSQHQQQLPQVLLATLEQTRAELYRYYFQHQAWPQTEAELALTEPLLTPWQQQISLRLEHKDLLLIVPVPRARLVHWLKARLVNAQETLEAGQIAVMLRISPPLQVEMANKALYRVAIPEQPELNTMQTDLNMGGFALTHFSSLDAEQALLTELSATRLQAELLQAQQLTVHQLQATTADITQLQAETLQLEDFFSPRATFTNLVSEQHTTQVLKAQQIIAEQLSAQQVTATQIQAQHLVAHEIEALDFISQGRSFQQAYQQLQQLELLWLACIAAGGCR